MVKPFGSVITARTRIRMATDGDARFVADIENDADLKRLVGGVSGRSEEFYRGTLSSKGFQYLIVDSLSTGLPIGRCGLITHHSSNECEIHVVLARDHSEKGIGTEVAMALKGLAADRFPDKTLTAKVHPDNVRSLAIISKLGLARTGTKDSEKYDNGWFKFEAAFSDEPS